MLGLHNICPKPGPDSPSSASRPDNQKLHRIDFYVVGKHILFPKAKFSKPGNSEPVPALDLNKGKPTI